MQCFAPSYSKGWVISFAFSNIEWSSLCTGTYAFPEKVGLAVWLGAIDPQKSN
jgi:hypothetical protein